MAYPRDKYLATLSAYGPAPVKLPGVRTTVDLIMAGDDGIIDQRYALKFMQREGETASNAYAKLLNVYGQQCMSQSLSLV